MQSPHWIWLALCAALGTHASAAKREVDYAAIAGPSISSAPFTRLSGWQEVAPSSHAPAFWPTQLIVHAGPRRAYLLTLFAPCESLDFSVEIGVSSFGQRISAGFDKVLVPHRQSCRIKTIQAIDLKALRAAERAARKAKA